MNNNEIKFEDLGTKFFSGREYIEFGSIFLKKIIKCIKLYEYNNYFYLAKELKYNKKKIFIWTGHALFRGSLKYDFVLGYKNFIIKPKITIKTPYKNKEFIVGDDQKTNINELCYEVFRLLHFAYKIKTRAEVEKFIRVFDNFILEYI